MKHIQLLLALFFLNFSAKVVATTWDEPWQDKVIKEAEYFVLAKIKSFDEKKGVKIEIIKSLAGPALEGKIKITDFYLLDICSRSAGHGPEFRFNGINECYFFLKKNSKGKYSISTPTSGFAYIKEGNVYATYRHSYNQALVPPDVYEKTMTAIFNYYHKLPFDQAYINDYVSKNLALAPAGFSKSEIPVFFAQHVALECIYHLRLTTYFSKIIPFLNDTSNIHHQLSAARALIAYNSAECKTALMNVIADTASKEFVQVLCIWTLKSFRPTELKSRLQEAEKTASKESVGFGGNIMDPRVCTNIPSVKSAIADVIREL
jgi:hypothetical protein